MNDAPPGVSGDRTVLAWQRTALSVLVGAAVLSRLTGDRLGTAALAGLAVTALLVLWVVVVVVGAAGPRGRKPAVVRARDGRPTAALSAGIVVAGLTELAAVLVGGSGV